MGERVWRSAKLSPNAKAAELLLDESEITGQGTGPIVVMGDSTKQFRADGRENEAANLEPPAPEVASDIGDF